MIGRYVSGVDIAVQVDEKSDQAHTDCHWSALAHACQTLRKSADASSRSSQLMSKATAALWALTRSARSRA